MKKLWLVLTAAILIACCSLNVLAADGKELLDSAELYITFDEKIEDVTDNYELYIEGDVALVEGRFGTAGNIVSGLNYIGVEELKFGTDSFTVSTWINVHEHAGDPVLFGNKDWTLGTNIGWLLCIRGSDWKYNANAEGGSRTDSEYPFHAASIESELDSWYHVAISVDRAANTYTFYVNGNKIGLTTDFASKNHTEIYDDEGNMYTFSIGEDGTTIYNMGQTLNVDFDEFAVWKKALTAEEIVSVYTYAPEGYEAATVAESAANAPLEFTSDPAEVVAGADLHLAFDGSFEDLTGNYTVSSIGTTELVEGVNGQAAALRSGANYLTVDDFKFGTDSFTASMWLNCRAFEGNDPAIFSNKDWTSGANPGMIFYYKGANWQYNVNGMDGSRLDCTYVIATSGVSAQFNEWANVTIVCDREAQTLTFYVNGRQYDEIVDFSGKGYTTAFDDETNNYPLMIGNDAANYSASNKIDFDCDEFIIWKKALTADEVAAAYTYTAAAVTGDAPAASETPAETEAPAAEENAIDGTYMSVEKNVFEVGEPIMVTAKQIGSDTDWIGLYEVEHGLPGTGWSSTQWFYAWLAEDEAWAISDGDGPMAYQELPAGEYAIYYCFNDDYEVGQTINITIVDPNAPAETEAEVAETEAAETEAEVAETEAEVAETEAPETEAEVVETEAPETEAEAAEEADAPQTFDFGVIAALAAIIAAAGYAVSRKR